MTDTITDNRKAPGYFRVDNEVMENYQLNPHAGWLYCAIAKYAGANGDAFPSMTTLASLTGMSKPTVIKNLAELEKRNLIKVERKKGKGKRNSVNHYFVQIVVKKSDLEFIEAVNLLNHSGKPPLLPPVNHVDRNKTQENNTQDKDKNITAAGCGVATDEQEQPTHCPTAPEHEPGTQRIADRVARGWPSGYIESTAGSCPDLERGEQPTHAPGNMEDFTDDKCPDCGAYMTWPSSCGSLHWRWCDACGVKHTGYDAWHGQPSTEPFQDLNANPNAVTFPPAIDDNGLWVESLTHPGMMVERVSDTLSYPPVEPTQVIDAAAAPPTAIEEVIQAFDVVLDTLEASDTVPTRPEPEPATLFKQMWVAVGAALGNKSGWWAGKRANMLLGTVKDKSGGWLDNQMIEQPATVAEVLGFGAWWTIAFPDAAKPTSAAKLRDNIERFRGEAAYTGIIQRIEKMIAAEMDFDAIVKAASTGSAGGGNMPVIPPEDLVDEFEGQEMMPPEEVFALIAPLLGRDREWHEDWNDDEETTDE